MNFKIDNVNIESEEFEGFEIDEQEQILSNLNKFNVFIGVNNSGKSRFVRSLFKMTQYNFEIISSDENIENIIIIVNQIFNNLQKLIETKGFQEKNITTAKNFQKKLDEISKLSLRNAFSVQIVNTFLSELSFLDDGRMSDSFWGLKVQLSVSKSTKAGFISEIKKVRPLLKKMIEKNDFEFIYLPILRGLRPLSAGGSSNSLRFSEHSNRYLARTLNDYFLDENEQQQGKSIDNVYETQIINKGKEIVTGIEMFNNLTEAEHTSFELKAKINEFKSFLSQNFFDGLDVDLLPQREDKIVHVKVGDNDGYPIYNLGDGLSSIIILTYYLFLNKDKKLLVFIEEPETHLHPQWQHLLLNALKQFDNHQFFFTTHSSCFINQSDTSVFSVFQRDDKTMIKPLLKDDEKIGILNELGYQASDLFQANYILWVEGKSDEIYFKHWIQAVASELIYGVHYTIMFYAGDNLKHINIEDNSSQINLLKLNQNVGIFFDSDLEDGAEGTSKSDIRKESLKSKFEEKKLFAWLTKRPTIESYIPISFLHNFLEQKELNAEIFPETTIIEVEHDPNKKRTKYKENGEEKPLTSSQKIALAYKTSRQSVRLDVCPELEERINSLVAEIRKANNLPDFQPPDGVYLLGASPVLMAKIS